MNSKIEVKVILAKQGNENDIKVSKIANLNSNDFNNNKSSIPTSRKIDINNINIDENL